MSFLLCSLEVVCVSASLPPKKFDHLPLKVLNEYCTVVLLVLESLNSFGQIFSSWWIRSMFVDYLVWNLLIYPIDLSEKAFWHFYLFSGFICQSCLHIYSIIVISKKFKFWRFIFLQKNVHDISKCNNDTHLRMKDCQEICNSTVRTTRARLLSQQSNCKYKVEWSWWGRGAHE